MKKDEIMNRIALCRFSLALLETAKDDPRYPDAKKEYERQLAVLLDRLSDAEQGIMKRIIEVEQEQTAGESKPPPTVVQLKTAVLNLKEGSIKS